MIIGVDFDNTIVCYDGIFHTVALERDLVPAELPTDKTSVRNYLRSTGREQAWTELQGYVYGPRLEAAAPYPGVIEFFKAALSLGIEVRIISHKTRRPFAGEPHDLHSAAWKWLEASGILTAPFELPKKCIFLEETFEHKFERIQTEGCTHFIDDLPEFLKDPRFPNATNPILFAPQGASPDNSPLNSAKSWPELEATLLPPHPSQPMVALARSILNDAYPASSPMMGGANSRVFSFQGASKHLIVKSYHHNPADPRDRFKAEHRFYSLLASAGVPSVPVPLGWDFENRLCALSAVSGTKLSEQQISKIEVQQCIDWICNLQQHRTHLEAASVPDAADACFSIREHLELLDHRAGRTLNAAEQSSHLEFSTFVREDLIPRIRDLARSIITNEGICDSPLPQPHRILSPSDFGFHNALRDHEGRMWFFDFEYAGWDDPAKLLCDFFCQPQTPVDLCYADSFTAALEEATGDASLAARFRLLLPLHAAKWSCILLNEFMPGGADRRRFAGVRLSQPGVLAAQLEKSRRMLAFSKTLHARLTPYGIH
jgi:hypothetical protein